MSQRPDSPATADLLAPARRHLVPCLVGMALATFGATTPAQTIADYSRSQRAVLEAAMTQNAARVASLLAPAASAAATAASASTPRVLLPPPEPVLRVSGVFTSPQRAVAEVVVDGAVFLLAAGQAVPGTGWHVASITPERVTLARPAEARESGHPVPAQRTFQLASAR